jgi:hypothetical protein
MSITNTVAFMSAILSMVVILCPNAFAHAGEIELSADVAKGQTARLAVLPDVPDDVKDVSSIAYVYVIAKSKVIAKANTTLDSPILFEDLSASGQVRIEIVPCYGYKQGLSGSCDATIKAGELTTVRIALKKVAAKEMAIQIMDVDKKPLSEKLIWFVEVMEGLGAASHNVETLETDDTGFVKQWVFPGRQYRCVVEKPTAHEIQEFRSPLYSLNVKNDEQQFTWKLEEPKILVIRLVEKIDGRPVPVKQLSKLQVVPVGMPDDRGRGISIKDGTIVLSKQGYRLQGASKARVFLNTNMVPFQIANNQIEIDDRAKQYVDIELVRIRDVKVAFRTDIAEAQAYLIRNKATYVIRKPGQVATFKSGDYRAIAWAAGYTVQETDMTIDGEKTLSLEYRPEKADVVTASVVDEGEKPIPHAEVRCRYAHINCIPTQRVQTGKNGTFSIALDKSRRRVLAVVSDRGGQLIRLPENESLKRRVVAFRTPCIVTGKILREEELMTSTFPGTKIKSRPVRQRIFLFDSSCHDLLLAEAKVAEDGSFQLPAQPGRYDVVLFAVGDGVVVGQIEVKEGDSKLDMGNVKVTNALWKKAESIPSHVK